MVQLDSNRIRTPQGRRILAHIDTDYQQVTPEQSADPIQKYRVGGLVIQNCLTINILQYANPPTSVPNFVGFFNPIPRTAMLSLTNDTEDLCAPSKHGTNLDNLAGQILTDKIITICILKHCNITLSKHACQVVCFFMGPCMSVIRKTCRIRLIYCMLYFQLKIMRPPGGLTYYRNTSFYTPLKQQLVIFGSHNIV